jgi:hypothetical protein
VNKLLRKGLPLLPRRMRTLPIDRRGYPIPWFVFTNDDGTRDFRVADASKRGQAVRDRLCWICGQRLGHWFAFVIGPMCAVNRNTSEPPCHFECAFFAVQACPFMTLPEAQYRSANLPSDTSELPHAIDGNPGAVAIWITGSFKPYRTGGSWLIDIGPPERVHWYAEGRVATRAEIVASLDRRLPRLMEAAQAEGSEAIAALERSVGIAAAFLPDGPELPALIDRQKKAPAEAGAIP